VDETGDGKVGLTNDNDTHNNEKDLSDEAHNIQNDKQNEKVLGYIFGVCEETQDTTNTYAHKNFYIDDFCVDENARGKHVGTTLYDYVKVYVKEQGYDRITLHVWSFNEAARKFYDSLGFFETYTAMEQKV
ncbi:MAG: GNAT family N-acetyltransferase, partial [Lachnospiraceae bacterium]|nr:GNAT family N-acetyltransferase [Lachnospiraceae bacterium]